MCGIVGFVRRGDALPVQESERTLRLMADAVRHRGPDGEGYLVAGPAALGHRRLSIIDLATGAQPMRNEDGAVAIVFNGEIYNFPELRPKLEKAGHVFRTQSDTEVILHAYEEYGTECLQHFNGMFAFALWDAKKRRLFAARDRMGKKPLYYAVRNDTLIFGSELTALLKHPLVKPIVTPYTVSRYLAFGYVPAPDTIYDQVYKLLPAQMADVRGRKAPSRNLLEARFREARFLRSPGDGIAPAVLGALPRCRPPAAGERRAARSFPLRRD